MTSGWVFFAGTVLFVIGVFNLIYGLIAIFQDEVPPAPDPAR